MRAHKVLFFHLDAKYGRWLVLSRFVYLAATLMGSTERIFRSIGHDKMMSTNTRDSEDRFECRTHHPVDTEVAYYTQAGLVVEGAK